MKRPFLDIERTVVELWLVEPMWTTVKSAIAKAAMAPSNHRLRFGGVVEMN
jgi:hypothetical protein